MNDGNWKKRYFNPRDKSNRGSYNRGGFNRGRPGRFTHRGFRGSYNNSGNRDFNQSWNRSKPEVPSKKLSEADIGVTEYVSDHEGFKGIIKLRYSDFQVAEINLKGEVAKLTNVTPPKPPEDDAIVEDEDLLLSKYNLEILTMDVWDSINKLAVCTEPTSEKVEIDVTGMTKEQRTKIHDAVKKAFADSIVGSTVTVEDKKYVRFEKYRKGVRIDNRVKWMWPGEYLHFIVHKENCDTLEAASRIAERLRLNIKPSMLGYAGTKDRRAKTSQWFSLRKVPPARVATACANIRDLRLGNYSFSDTHLKLGMLKGNVFRIALRNVTAASAAELACERLRDRGFINYYGLQRFGTRFDVPTYVIGLKLLQDDFKGAIDVILKERDGPLHHILRTYRESGPEAAFRLIPRKSNMSCIETRLIAALAYNPKDLLGAFGKLSRNTCLLYVHAYQSWVWNRAASRRLQLLGLQPAPGDLVLLQQTPEECIDDPMENDDSSDSESEQSNDKPEKEELPEENVENPKIPIRVLTEKDVESGRYKIQDIVLPLPGSRIEYPPNLKDYYEEMLTADGLTLDMKHRLRSYSLGGAYRRVCVAPGALRWERVRYGQPRADLLRSDADELDGLQLTGVTDDGKYTALLLTMNLPSSCYATMALRELMKMDTAADHQARQNHHDEQPDAVGDKRKAESESQSDVDKKRIKE